MKHLWIIANFKSNFNLEQVLSWLEVVGPKLIKKENMSVVVCPTFTSLEEVKKKIQSSNYPILVGSQDLSPFDEGSFTGEEAASILKQYVDYSILGHSERRKNFAETDELVAQKVNEAKKHNIIPVVCVQDESTPIPPGVGIIAYEPIFAIGTGNPDTPENAEKVAQMIKTKDAHLTVLYGGSVNSDNCEAFIQKESISGLLIGKSSLDPDEFLNIIDKLLTY